MLQKTSFRLHHSSMMLHNFLFIVHFPISRGKIGVFTVFGNSLVNGLMNGIR